MVRLDLKLEASSAGRKIFVHGGISFELAALVFEDQSCLVYMDRIDDHTGEQRWIALGVAQPTADAAILLVVAHVYREDNYDEEIILIISARETLDEG